MGYERLSQAGNFTRPSPREKPGTGALALADTEGGIGHGDELNSSSDFPQEIV
jgi:hypothetical protein